MRTLLVWVLSVMILLSWSLTSAQDRRQDQWQGTYDFSGAGGREVGGIAVFLDITLKISPSGNCEITREGYQVLDTLICSTKKNIDGIDILFKSFPGGKIENKYGHFVYRRGERLFSLSKKPGSKALITDWGLLKPEGYANKNRGVFFKRSN